MGGHWNKATARGPFEIDFSSKDIKSVKQLFILSAISSVVYKIEVISHRFSFTVAIIIIIVYLQLNVDNYRWIIYNDAELWGSCSRTWYQVFTYKDRWP